EFHHFLRPKGQGGFFENTALIMVAGNNPGFGNQFFVQLAGTPARIPQKETDVLLPNEFFVDHLHGFLEIAAPKDAIGNLLAVRDQFGDLMDEIKIVLFYGTAVEDLKGNTDLRDQITYGVVQWLVEDKAHGTLLVVLCQKDHGTVEGHIPGKRWLRNKQFSLFRLLPHHFHSF